MAKKINEVEVLKIETRNEMLWFSYIKGLTKQTDFGTIEMTLTIKSGQVTNISNAKVKNNFNINPDNY